MPITRDREDASSVIEIPPPALVCVSYDTPISFVCKGRGECVGVWGWWGCGGGGGGEGRTYGREDGWVFVDEVDGHAEGSFAFDTACLEGAGEGKHACNGDV